MNATHDPLPAVLNTPARRSKTSLADVSSLIADSLPQSSFATRATPALLAVFALSMFASATLLFLVEPMLAKMALPLLGGTPAVWNTCLVFFQSILLAGYLYAHASTKWLSHRTQIAVHLSLVLLPFAVLPLRIPGGWEPPADRSPVLWVLGMLLVIVGPPFFLLSASTPILQRWFAQSGHPSAEDPYFLYAASNAGSLIGLLSYPLLLEPLLRLSTQSHLWTYGYSFFVLLTVACAAAVWKAIPSSKPITQSQTLAEERPKTIWRQRLRWTILALVPSSLMIGVTTELTTNVPAIPLFWVLPLALYLVSFIFVFAKRQIISHAWLIRRLPFLLLFALFPTISRLKFPLLVLIPVYLATLFAVALVCHGELALSRPKPARLTEFYLWMSFGGVLGGIFNALIAPQIFSSVLEFPIVLIAAALLRPAVDILPLSPSQTAKVKRNDWLLPLTLAAAMAAVLAVLHYAHIKPGPPITILFVGYSMLFAMSFGKRPIRFAAGLAIVIALGSLIQSGPYGETLHTERSFFGVLRVANDPSGRFRYLMHGAIIHGIQSLNPAESREPLAYYTKSGPAGSIVNAVRSSTPHPIHWAILGEGAGAMACYNQPGDPLTYYEIDPSVVRIAADPHYFTFMNQCAPTAKIVLGDARLKLRNAPDASYDLIVLDAFSGDSIPLHLLTREALALYQRKLAPGGILAFHISNLYLQLGPTLGTLANDAGLVARLTEDNALTPTQVAQGKLASRWVVMAQSESNLHSIATDQHWSKLQTKPNAKVWTDDYSNPLSIIKWN